MIVDELLERLADKANGKIVRDVRLGLGYTAVVLDDGGCGLAYTFRDEAHEGCSVLQQAGTMSGRSALGMAALAKALDTVSASVGLATLNALIEPPPEAFAADVRGLIRVRVGDVVGMVGHFAPLVGWFRQQGVRLHILERRPTVERDIHPEWTASILLPECDVVVITAASLVTRTIDGILEQCVKAREVAVLGPSTPLHPEVFAKRGVTLLSGVHVEDSAKLLRIVSEGGGTREFSTAVRKLTLRLNQ
jgi:uncharacterized protein (DUF4213/DUF364 family)